MRQCTYIESCKMGLVRILDSTLRPIRCSAAKSGQYKSTRCSCICVWSAVKTMCGSLNGCWYIITFVIVASFPHSCSSLVHHVGVRCWNTPTGRYSFTLPASHINTHRNPPDAVAPSIDGTMNSLSHQRVPADSQRSHNLPH